MSAQAQGGGGITDGHLTEVLKYRQQTDTQSDKLRQVPHLKRSVKLKNCYRTGGVQTKVNIFTSLQQK